MKKLTPFKRAGSPWLNIDFWFKGKRYTHSLETSKKKEALARARAYYTQVTEAAIRDDQAAIAATKLHGALVVPLVKVFAAYARSGVDALTRTRHLNELALRKIILGSGEARDPAALPSTIIDASLARRWFTAAKLQANNEPDQEKQHTIYRSANSWFNQANSLFAAKALDFYRQEKVFSPGFLDFYNTGRLLRFGAKYAPDSPYDPAPPALLAATLDAWQRLKDEPMTFHYLRGKQKRTITVRGRDMFLAIGHELAYGLRRAEVAQARWSWWTNNAEFYVLSGKATVKNGSAHLRVTALDPWFTTLRERIEKEAWRPPEADAYLIAGGDTYRKSDLFRAIGSWMRTLGWQTQKTNHAFRSYSGSQIIMRYDPFEAQRWLRHSTLKVTMKFYAKYVNDYPVADKTTLPARWAALPAPAPAPTPARPSVSVPLRPAPPILAAPPAGRWN